MHALNETIKCIFIPHFIVLIILIFLLFLEKRTRIACAILSILCFAIVWREALNVSSSRYCAGVIVIYLCAFLVTLKKQRLSSLFLKYFFVLIFAGLIVFNICETYHSFRNTYIFDVSEQLNYCFEKAPHSVVLLDKKDLLRFSHFVTPPKKKKDIYQYFYDDIDSTYKQYEFWKKDAFLLIKTTAKGPKKDFGYLYDTKSDQIKLGQYFTDKHKNKCYSFYRQSAFYPQKFLLLKEKRNITLNKIIEEGILKSCYPTFDTYIFQVNNTLYWIIGIDTTKDFEIIYHIDTDRPDLLPPRRIKVGFDNLGFHSISQKPVDRFDHYSIYKKNITVEYPITQIRVGFSFFKKPTWFMPFKVSPFDSGESLK